MLSIMANRNVSENEGIVIPAFTSVSSSTLPYLMSPLAFQSLLVLLFLIVCYSIAQLAVGVDDY